VFAEHLQPASIDVYKNQHTLFEVFEDVYRVLQNNEWVVEQANQKPFNRTQSPDQPVNQSDARQQRGDIMT